MGKSYEKTNNSISKEAGRPMYKGTKGCPCHSLLPLAHSLGGPNPEAHSQEVRILMPGSVPALETQSKHMGHGPCS